MDERVDYSAITACWRARDGGADRSALVELLIDAWADDYRGRWRGGELLEFSDRGARYLFDTADGTDRAPRTVAAHTVVPETVDPRDTAYQRGYPAPPPSARPLDKGHLVPRSAGGDFGPNIYPQDRALNRGWSADGRRYRRWNVQLPRSPTRCSSAG